jgi:hypothetical protein
MSDEKPRYKCPKCGETELGSDGEIWCRMNPNTLEVISDYSAESAKLTPAEGIFAGCHTNCQDCGFESDYLRDFDTQNQDHGEDPPCVACGAPESVCECAP